MLNYKNKQIVFASLLCLAVASRFLPHVANFVPIGAFTLFLSAKLNPKYSLAFIILAMAISDLFLGFSFASVFVYLGMLGYVLFGSIAKRGIGFALGAAVLSALTFYLISNFGVWLGPWYTHSLAGLIECYTLAIPFFKNTLISDVIFSAIIFILYEVYQQNKRGVFAWQNILKKPTLKPRS